MASLRELLLEIKVKVDKAAVRQTDVAFDHASGSAEKFEARTTAALSPLKKIAAQLSTNTKLAEKFAKAMLPAGALTNRPEAPSNRNARLASEVLGLPGSRSFPAPPRAGGHPFAAPDISAFMVPEKAPDFRTGPQRAVAAGLSAIRSTAQSAMASAGAAVERFNARFDKVAASIFNARTAMAGFAIVIAGTAIGRFVGDVIEAGGALHDMSERTRVSVETLQVWRGIAQDAGVDTNAIEGAFRKLTKSMAAAARGSKLQASSFKTLGVEVKNADGSLRPVEDVLIDTGSALAAMDDDAKATAIAVQILGPAGMGLVPAFNQGADAVRRLSAEMKENVALNAAEAARLDDVGDALNRGEKKWVALKTRAIVAILPFLEMASKAFESVSKFVLRMSKETEVLHTIILAITAGGIFRLVTMLGAWIVRVGGARAAMALLGGGLRSAAVAAAQFVLPLLLIEDFLTFLAGGKSVFGRAFEEIFGAGGAKEKRQEFLNFFQEVSKALNGILPALGGIAGSPLFQGAAKKALDAVLAVLNAIGLALTDDAERAAKLTDALSGHLQSLGVLPSKDEAQKQNNAGLPEDLGGAKRAAPSFADRFARKAMVAVFGDPLKDQNDPTNKHNAEVVAQMRADKANHPGGMIGPPAASPIGPPAPPRAAVNLTDQRKIEINVGPNSKPGETGRAVGTVVDGALIKDRRQTLNALAG